MQKQSERMPNKIHFAFCNYNIPFNFIFFCDFFMFAFFKCSLHEWEICQRNILAPNSSLARSRILYSQPRFFLVELMY